ncbi:MAG TPA: hypothetical protein VNO52_13540, partial [Methylomirabilota bacterium]|nr:hypothetical protein [Methylomirabilota bacterium]
MSDFLQEQSRSSAPFRTLAGLAGAAIVWGGLLGNLASPARGADPSEDPDRTMAADPFLQVAANERQEL